MKSLTRFLLIFIYGLLIIQCERIHDRAWKPVGAIDELYKIERLPYIRSGVVCRMFSSYDRTGGNNDGFGGTYSKIRVEKNHSVLAEMSGSGCIYRIWFTHSEFETNGLLAGKGEHIKIYLDGKDEPSLNVSLEKMFSGELPRFPRPLVGEALGGYYCYVPIPYQNGCKVMVEGTDVRFYQITYCEFPNSKSVRSFSMDLDQQQNRAMARAVKVWSNPGDENILGLNDLEKEIYLLDLEENDTKNFSLPEGTFMIRAVILEGDSEGLKHAGNAKIQFFWDNAHKPAVDVPIQYLFGKAFESEPYKSLLTGINKSGWYNYIPMPYRKTAYVQIMSQKAFSCKLILVIKKMMRWSESLGYFHAFYHEQIPTTKGNYYTLLRRQGNGHYIGTYLAIEMKKPLRLPYWLEGDERFFLNDSLLIHGTGTEDYFNCGWYAVDNRLNTSGALTLHGFPVFRGTLKKGFTQTVAYRWHISDVVPYEGNFLVEIEHGPQNNVQADYRSSVFYYDVLPGL